MIYKYHKDGALPENNEIFVFGSNLAGIHGAGAAKVAHEKFGAKWGRGHGLVGNSYAIPTKDRLIESLSLEDIEMYVWRFKLATQLHKDKIFFVSRVGCGLAGYKDSEIAPMFKGSNTNCSFAEEWKEYLEDDTH